MASSAAVYRRVAAEAEGQREVGARAERSAVPQRFGSLGNRIVQHLLRGGAGQPDAAASLAAAERGAASGGSRLMHGGEIQRAFGRHDVTGLVAHVGPDASAAARSIGARGFAAGRHLVFDAPPSLRVAAHEAAHAVQQRHLQGAPHGAARSACEEHAQVVADAVEHGHSAEPLLDAFAAAPVSAAGPGGAVQRVTEEDQLAAPLKTPDGLKRRAEVYRERDAVALMQHLAASNHVKIVEPAQDVQLKNGQAGRRVKIKWYEWHAGYQVKEGYVDEAAIAYGSTEQTAIPDDEKLKIVPPNAAGVRAEDVYQNGLSDCYLQAAMASTARHNPEAILDAIADNGRNVIAFLYLKAGKLPELGDQEAELVRTSVTLERSLFMGAKSQPVYGGHAGANHYLWPAFLGKAFAVVKGSYANLAMGQPYLAMKALTGHGDGRALAKASKPTEAWTYYEQLKTAVTTHRPAVLTTSTFVKSGFGAFRNAVQHLSGTPDLPQGEVRNLHSYAVMGITPTNLNEVDFAAAIPAVTVTLRDPRNATGATFTRTLKDIVTAGKFTSVHTG